MSSVACEEMPSTGKRCPPVLPWTPAEAQDTSPPPPSPHHTHTVWTLLPSLVHFPS